MIWFFIFLFAIVALNSGVVYTLLKRAGLEEPSLLLFSILALASAGMLYNVATNSSTDNRKESYEIHQKR